MTAPVLEVQRLKKHFPVTRGLALQRTIGWVRAVNDVSFSIRPGETLSLVGESGAGKTTVARAVLLLEEPSDGALLFHGKDVLRFNGSELKEYRSNVQAVFQDPWGSMNPRMRVKTIVAEPLAVNTKLSKTEIRDKVLDLMRQVGLRPDQADLYPHEFSGGQRQRIAVARALALNPQLVVLDEPVSALDVSIRAQIMNLLKDIQATYGLSYLLIAHNLATVRYMSHAVAIMYLGEIVEFAEGDELFEQPLHPYTKALLSAALAADPDSSTEEIVLSGEMPSPLNPPRGCHFHPRCPMAMDICREVAPPVTQATPKHTVSCHLYP
ncbi:MAG: dipeptide ABC transporter ATP-binding protein [Chloroflexi bacterium]|nr:dipeptide ABC transporter ATP-binding protein [Chloroflexota bacterium]MBV9898250.1 dipeptide ABC transporter ATP-binding protein [Chloroflexota bacterium]